MRGAVSAMNKYSYGGDVPLGFGMALAQDRKALEGFARLTPEGRQSVIDGAARVSSREEMREYVHRLACGDTQG